MKEKPLLNWTTEDEFRYLRSIGEHTKQYTRIKNRLSVDSKIHRKKELLLKAVDAYSKRVEWGIIDRNKVIAFAMSELAGL